MQKYLAEDVLSEELNDIGCEFWNYIEPKMEEFFLWCERFGYKTPIDKDGNRYVLNGKNYSIYYLSCGANDLKPVEDIIKEKKMHVDHLMLSLQDTPTYKVMIHYPTKDSRELQIQIDKCTLAAIRENKWNYIVSNKKCREIVFYPSYKWKNDSSNTLHPGGVTLHFDKKKIPYSFDFE